MPNGQEFTAVNPTTGKRVKWDGSAWVPMPEPEGAMTKIGRGAAVGTFKGAGIQPTMNPVMDTLKALLEQAGTAMGSKAWQGKDPHGIETMKANPLVAVPTALASGFLDVTEDINPIIDNLFRKLSGRGNYRNVDPEKTAEDSASLATSLLLLKGGRKAAETPLAESEVLRGGKAVAERPISAIHDYLGGDARSLERAQSEHAQKMEEINQANISKQNTIDTDYRQALKEAEAKHQEAVNTAEGTTLQKQATHRITVDQIKQDHAAKLAKQAQQYKDDVSAAAREHEQAVRGLGGKAESVSPNPVDVETKEAFNARRGEAWQRVKGMTDKIASTIDPLEQKVRAAQNTRWGAWRVAMGPDTTGDFTPVMKAVEEAEKSLAGQPENIKIFRDILAEGEDPILANATVFKGGAGIDVKDIIGSRFMSEGTKNRVVQSLRDAGISEETGRMPIQETTMPIDDIRQWSTDLKKKMFGKYDAKIYRALKTVQKAAEEEVGRVAKGKGQLELWERLKKDYAQKLEDFDDSGGPLHKLRNAVNTEARLNLLTGAEADRIIDALGRYDKFVERDASGQSTMNMAGKVRSVVHQIENLSKPQRSVPGYQRPVRPEKPEMKNLPYPPTPEPVPQFKPPKKPEFTPKETTPFSPEQFRRETFLKTVKKFKTFGFDDKGAIMAALLEIFHGNLPLALSYPVVKRILGTVMDRKSIEDWVARERPSATPPGRVSASRGSGPSRSTRPNLSGAGKAMRYEVLKKTIEDDDKALLNPNLSDAERERIERHKADFEEQLGEVQ